MLFENSENNKQREKNSQPFSSSTGNENTSFDIPVNDGSDITPEWDALKKRTADKLDYLTTPVDKTTSENRFRNSFGSYMVPKDSPQRHRKNYALSNEALDDVLGDYYDNTIKGAFDTKREESKKRGREEYKKYASVPGANPENAFKELMRTDDPMRVVDETMSGIDDDELMEKAAPLASYGGYDTREYVDNFVKPSLRNKMVDELVDENTPKSSAEYIVRSAYDNSLMGKLGTIAAKSDKAIENNRMLATDGVANYKPNRLENFAAGVGGLLIDTPLFSGLGVASSSVVGHATSKLTDRLAKKVLSRYSDRLVSKNFADAVAGKVIKERIKNRILQNSATQGLTLGGYDVANSVADDILNNSSLDVGKAAGAFAKGFTTGAAAGLVGNTLKARSRGLTGGKKLLSSAGVLSAESAVFTAAGEADKLAHGVEIKPIDLVYDFGESAATLLTMRMAGWRPTGAEQKLNKQGKIKDELQLSNSERQELREMNVNPDEFVGMLEKELRMPSLGSSDAKLLKENYALLMSNKNLSASAKSKLMYLVENKITSTPPAVFDYKVEKNEKGIWKVKLLDAGGNVVEKLDFPNAGNAKSHLILKRGDIRRNRIAYYERELTAGADSQNFLHEAGLYAKENGVDADVVAEAMYKSARNEKLNNQEQKIMDDIIARSAGRESKTSRLLANARRDIEQRYNLEKGALSYAVDKRFLDCSAAENKALDEYEAIVRSEVENTKTRTEATDVEAVSDGYDMSNVERRSIEADEYRSASEQRHAGQGRSESVPRKLDESMMKVQDNEPGKVWNALGNDISESTVKEFEKRGTEFSKKFGQDIVFITDEHQIDVPDKNDKMAVANYNNCLKSLGWVNKGKVYINLPNIKDMAELENTIVHEVVGHAGLKKVFGNYMYDFLEDVYKTADGSVRAGIDKMRATYTDSDYYTVTEEYLAHLAEKAYPNAQERNLLVRFKDFVKGMLIRNNMFKSKYRRVSEEELQSIIKAHTRSVLNKKERARHRNEVFNRFASAHFKEDGYYDRKAYEHDKTEMAKEESFRTLVPKNMIGSKYLVNYPYYSEDIRKEIVKNSEMSDKELREQSEAFNYRFEGEKGAKNYGKVYPEEPGRRMEDAEHYEKSGVMPWYIKKLTGWERGADGKWRKEVAETGGMINDYIHLALFDNKPELSELYDKIKEKPFEAWGENEKNAWDKIIREGYPYMKNAVLEDVVTDDNFFLSYPELASMPVKIVTNGASLARYDNKNKEMVIDRNLFVSPNAAATMAGALQNVIQDYEGFSKAVSLHMLSLEGRLANKYKKAQECIALLDGMSPSFDKNADIARAFRREYGMNIATFKKKYPTYDDYLFHKLTNRNLSFSGNVEMNNVRKRYDMSNAARSVTLAEETEYAPRKKQMVIKNLDDLKKYFKGPLDIINNAILDVHSDKPLKLKKLEGRLNRARLTPVELAEFDDALDSYTKFLLREMVEGKKPPKDPYGYEEYREKANARSRYIKEQADKYRKEYEKDNKKDVSSDYFKN